MTPEQEQYLREHRLGALATGRRDGSLQLTWISYDHDGADIVLQTSKASAKARNIARKALVFAARPRRRPEPRGVGGGWGPRLRGSATRGYPTCPFTAGARP